MGTLCSKHKTVGRPFGGLATLVFLEKFGQNFVGDSQNVRDSQHGARIQKGAKDTAHEDKEDVRRLGQEI